MAAQEKNDWRLRSQARGLWVLSLALPLLLAGLYGSSQRTRTTEQVLWNQAELQSRPERFTLSINGVQRTQVPLQFQLEAKAGSAVAFPKSSFRYEVWSQRKELITRRSINLPTQDSSSSILRLPVIMVEGGQRYLVRYQIQLSGKDQSLLRSWQIKLVQDPLQRSELWLQSLEVLVYPALSILLLALAMIFGPSLIR